MRRRALPVLPLPQRAAPEAGRRSLTVASALLGLGICGSATGQGASGMRRVGILSVASAVVSAQRIEAFRQGMRELGWIEGVSVQFHFAFADGDTGRVGALARALVDQGMDVIVTGSGVSTRALQQATKTIPIVMVTVADPMANRFIASFSRPGGNITGLSNQQEDVIGKLVELVHSVTPAAKRIAVVVNENNPSHAALWTAAQRACQALGVQPVRVAANGAAQLADAVAEIVRQRAQLVVVSADPMYTSERERLQFLFQATGLPVAYGLRDHVVIGGLLSYGVNFTEQWRHAAKFVDRILKGAKPADLPVEQPTRFELVINLKTAKALGLAIPPSLLLRADEVIQ